MAEHSHDRRRLRRPLQIATSVTIAAVLASVLLSEAGAMAPMAQALGYGYEAPTATPTPTATPIPTVPPTAPPIVTPPPVTPVADTTAPYAYTYWRLTAQTRRTLVRTGRIVTTLTLSEPSKVSQSVYRDKSKRPLSSVTTSGIRSGKVTLTLRLKAKDRKTLSRTTSRLVVRTSLVDVAGNLGSMSPLAFAIKRAGR